jgi:hypothetical protein
LRQQLGYSHIETLTGQFRRNLHIVSFEVHPSL